MSHTVNLTMQPTAGCCQQRTQWHDHEDNAFIFWKFHDRFPIIWYVYKVTTATSSLAVTDTSCSPTCYSPSSRLHVQNVCYVHMENTVKAAASLHKRTAHPHVSLLKIAHWCYVSSLTRGFPRMGFPTTRLALGLGSRDLENENVNPQANEGEICMILCWIVST